MFTCRKRKYAMTYTTCAAHYHLYTEKKLFEFLKYNNICLLYAISNESISKLYGLSTKYAQIWGTVEITPCQIHRVRLIMVLIKTVSMPFILYTYIYYVSVIYHILAFSTLNFLIFGYIILLAFQSERLCIKLAKSVTFDWSADTKLGKWAIMHICAKGIEFVSLYHFAIGFWKCSDSVAFVVDFWK